MGMPTVWCMPAVNELTGCSYVWHFTLKQAGWNELPRWRKPGKIVDMFSDGSIDVYWPGVNITTLCFRSELVYYKGGNR